MYHQVPPLHVRLLQWVVYDICLPATAGQMSHKVKHTGGLRGWRVGATHTPLPSYWHHGPVNETVGNNTQPDTALRFASHSVYKVQFDLR